LNFISKSKLGLVFTTITFLFSCSEVENDVYDKYQNTNLDFIVPTLCKGSIEKALNKFRIDKNIAYQYRKFLVNNNAYQQIDGYVSLKINEDHNMLDLYNLVIELTKECYASREFFYTNDDNGWEHFRRELDLIHSKNIEVHRIEVKKERLSIFVNLSEYDSKESS